VADGDVSGKRVKVPLPEDLGNQPHFGVDADGSAVTGGDAGAFLPSVLEGKKAKIS
jgi:hypothetical protein